MSTILASDAGRVVLRSVSPSTVSLSTLAVSADSVLEVWVLLDGVGVTGVQLYSSCNMLHVCATCTEDGIFVRAVRAAFPDWEVAAVDCMSGCTRAQTVAFREAGKVAYLFGDITQADFPDLATFARHYAASDDGTFEDARVLGELRSKAIARIPA